MAYTCRDCKTRITKLLKKDANRCPNCNSIYLIPTRKNIKIKKRAFKVTIGDRFLSLFFGCFTGLLTFFIWGMMIFLNGGGYARGSGYYFYYGVNISLFLAIAVGLIGFVMGSEKLFKLLGILWGTDAKFKRDFQDNATQYHLQIPQWLTITFLIIVIAGTYSYISILLNNPP